MKSKGHVVSIYTKIESTPEARQRVHDAVQNVMAAYNAPLKAGDKVQHKQTKRFGICLGEDKHHKGWYRVQWFHRQNETPYLYALDEVVKVND